MLNVELALSSQMLCHSYSWGQGMCLVWLSEPSRLHEILWWQVDSVDGNVPRFKFGL